MVKCLLPQQLPKTLFLVKPMVKFALFLFSMNAMASVALADTSWISIGTQICHETSAKASGTYDPFAEPYSAAEVLQPPYYGQFTFEAVLKYLAENGYRETARPVAAEYQDVYDRTFPQGQDGPLKDYGVTFVPPEGFTVERLIGKGNKGAVVLMRQNSTKETFAVKLPVSEYKFVESGASAARTVEKGRADYSLNLELEIALNAYLRQHYDRYHVRTIRIEAVGPKGSFMATKLFAPEAEFGSILHKTMLAKLPPDVRKAFDTALESRDEKAIGTIVKDAVTKLFPGELVGQLATAFSGIQQLALDTGLNIDFVSDNLAVLDGKVVLFDTGIRTQTGSRGQKYTVGSNFEKTGKPQTFDEWLGIFHINWLDKQGLLPARKS